MSYSQFDTFVRNGSCSMAPTTFDTIEGARVLRGTALNASANNGCVNIVPKTASGLGQGFTAGRLRTLVKQPTAGNRLADTSPNSKVFLVCMLSDRNIANNFPSRYALKLTNATMSLNKIIGGDANNDGTVLISVATSTLPGGGLPAAGGLFALELNWFYSVAEFGGMFLEGRYGVQADYSDLAVAVAVTDTSSPLTTSLAEGLEMFNSSTTPLILDFDKLEVYSASF